MSPSSIPAVTAASSWRDRLTPRWVLGLAVANLVAQILIILTGGIVRLTGSGLGCSTWPQCEPGEFTPVFHEAVTYHPFVEFGNRTLTGVLGVIAIALALAALLSPATRERRLSVRLLALAPLLGVLAQAVLGGVLVLLHLHPGLVGLHYVISAALVWASALLIVRLREGDAPGVPALEPVGFAARWLRAVPAGFAVLTTLVVVLGVLTTGSGPHSGDEEVGYRLALDPALLARFHAMSVWLFVAALVLTLWTVARTRVENPGQRRAAAAEMAEIRRARSAWFVLLLVTLAQGAIGYAQYFTGLPVPLVALHMLGSGLLVAAVTFAVTTLRIRGARTIPAEPFDADPGVPGVPVTAR